MIPQCSVICLLHKPITGANRDACGQTVSRVCRERGRALRSGPWTTHLFLKFKPWSPTAFVIALCVLAAAVGMRILFDYLGATVYFATFLPAVLIASLFAGAPAGVCAALLSIPIVWWAFLPPVFVVSWPTPADYRNFTMFLLESGLLIWFAQLCREAMMLQQVESSREF